MELTVGWFCAPSVLLEAGSLEAFKGDLPACVRCAAGEGILRGAGDVKFGGRCEEVGVLALCAPAEGCFCDIAPEGVGVAIV